MEERKRVLREDLTPEAQAKLDRLAAIAAGLQTPVPIRYYDDENVYFSPDLSKDGQTVAVGPDNLIPTLQELFAKQEERKG